MSKEAAAWLALRIIGLLLLAETFYLIFETVAHFVTAQKLGGIGGDLASQAERQALRSWVDTGISSAKVAISGCLCFYFLRRGKAFHRLLMWEAN